jgi:hypothetical protein
MENVFIATFVHVTQTTEPEVTKQTTDFEVTMPKPHYTDNRI